MLCKHQTILVATWLNHLKSCSRQMLAMSMTPRLGGHRCSVASDSSLPDVNCFIVSSALIASLNVINAPKSLGGKKKMLN